jgi:hypothetical protein
VVVMVLPKKEEVFKKINELKAEKELVEKQLAQLLEQCRLLRAKEEELKKEIGKQFALLNIIEKRKMTSRL